MLQVEPMVAMPLPRMLLLLTLVVRAAPCHVALAAAHLGSR